VVIFKMSLSTFFSLPLTGLALLAAPALMAQTAPPAPVAPAVYTFVEQMPVFRSQGSDSLLYYLQRSARYPPGAPMGEVKGRVFVSFVVNTQGQVEQVKLEKAAHPAFDQEALRAVAALPVWRSPGRQAGQPVNVAFTVPIFFEMHMASPQESHQIMAEQRRAARKATQRPNNN
jgi:protein TonB